MAIPSFRSFLRPVLEIMAEVEIVQDPRTNLEPLIVKKMGFTEQEVAERLVSGGSRLKNRIGWALTYLTKAGLVVSPQRKTFTITPDGAAFLKRHKGAISPKDLEEFPSYLDFKNASLNPSEKNETSQENISLDELDPAEKINIGYTEIKNALIDELKARMLQLNPTQFEELVLDLIRALGYGDKTGKIEHTGGSGDFGIDGIVHLDKLGLDKIYLQAKRYKPENKINSRQIQEFYGALKGRHATKGVFLTTSSYQESALQYAQTVSGTLVLIDGNRIAELMIESGVGVSVKRNIVIPAIDNDYFES